MYELLLLIGVIFIVWYLVWISNRQAEWYMHYNKVSTFYQEITIYAATIAIGFYVFLHVPSYIAKVFVLIVSFLLTSYEFKKVIESVS